MDTQLLINGFEVDLAERPTFPFSFSVVELTDLSKRSGASSKTITLPGTAVNQALFNSVFQLTSAQDPNGQVSALIDFDPTVKATAQVYQNGLLQFNGTAQLLSCKLSKGFWSFEVSLVSEVIDYVAKMQEVKINELDFSEYEHVLNLANVTQTWAGNNKVNGVTTSIKSGGNWTGLGYYYGLIDYGFPRNQPEKFGIADLPLQVFMYGILKKVFEKVGLTWDSVFLESRFFKRRALAYQGGQLPTVTPAQALNDSALNAETSAGAYILEATQAANIQQQVINGTPEYIISFGVATFADAIDVAVVQDLRSQMVTTSPALFRAAVRGLFNFHYVGRHLLELDFNLSGATISAMNASYTLRAVIYKNNAVLAIEDVYTGQITSTSLSQSFTIDYDYSRQINCEINDEVRVSLRLVMNFAGVDFTGYSGQGLSYDVKLSSIDTQVNFEKAVAQLTAGSTVYLSALLPDMTGSDYFNGICKMFNLLVSPDKFEPTKLMIEPLIDYYKPTNEALAFTHKLDSNEQIEIVPSVNFSAKRYLFNFQPSTDYFNAKYLAEQGLQYGSFEVVNQSQLVQSDTKYLLPFQQVPLADIPKNETTYTGLVVPRLFGVTTDELSVTNVQPYKGKSFVVQVGALRDGHFKLVDEHGSSHNYTHYPYVGHLDDIDAPTFDDNFGVPEVLYYAATTYTQNNLYQYHEQFIKELVSRFGRLVKCSIRWNEADIYALDFRFLLQIDGVVYRLQKISDYNPTNDNSTKTELLKYIS